MQSNELSFEMPAQELLDPRTAVQEAIEFDDLDTVLNPVLPSANDAAPEGFQYVEVELELEADAIDALLGASGQNKP